MRVSLSSMRVLGLPPTLPLPLSPPSLDFPFHEPLSSDLPLDFVLPLPLPRASTSMGSAVGSPSIEVQRRCACTIFTISPRTAA